RRHRDGRGGGEGAVRRRRAVDAGERRVPRAGGAPGVDDLRQGYPRHRNHDRVPRAPAAVPGNALQSLNQTLNPSRKEDPMSQLTASTPVEMLAAVDPSSPALPSKAARWAGRVMSGLAALFLLMDAAMKFVRPDVVTKGTVELGFPGSVILPLGVVLLV